MKKNIIPSGVLSLLTVVLSLFILTSCIEATKKTTSPKAPKLSPIEEAKLAYSQKHFSKAELLSQRLINQPNISKEELSTALKIYSNSAVKSNHPHAALLGLNKWKETDKGIDSKLEWQLTWLEANRQLSVRESENGAIKLTLENEPYLQTLGSYALLSQNLLGYNLPTIPENIKDSVSKLSNPGTISNLNEKLIVLNSLYTNSSTSEKANLEYLTALDLQKSSPSTLKELDSLVDENDVTKYPYSLIRVYYLLMKSNSSDKASAMEQINELKKKVRLADPSLFYGVKELDTQILPTSTATLSDSSSATIVLVLPMSTAYSKLSNQIIDGAKAALASSHSNLVVIDSDQPDWLSKIARLPKECSIIGGPIRSSDYVALKNSNLTSQRVFFTFLPSLDEDDEGKVAWRFFTSAQDQISALLNFTSSLNIKGYGIFYPEEPYGNKMKDVFTKTAEKEYLSTVKSYSFDPKKPNSWTYSLGLLLANNKNTKQAKSATFQTIFLPDSWEHAEHIIPIIKNYGEVNQIILGPAIWGPSISASKDIDASKYNFTVFSGAWSSYNTSPSAVALMSKISSKNITFLNALGYDFVNFTVALSSQGRSVHSVNQALPNININWAMAPINWNNLGQATQNLFLFELSETGPIPLNTLDISNRFSKAWF